MFRAFLLRSSPFAASAAIVAAAGPSYLEASEDELAREKSKITAEMLKLSQYKTLKALQEAGGERRADSGCSFCKWMVEGPCGKPIYVDWDDCVHETKQIEGRNFVEVCRPFTLALMACIEKHPDYYEELAKMEKESTEAKEPSAEALLEQEWEWKAAVSNMGQSQELLSAKAPGRWAGKEEKHVPVVASSGGRCTVTVPHGMAADHWIEYVWARDEATGSVLAVKKLKPTDKPELTFEVPAGVRTVTAFEACNLHGVWKTEPIAIEK